DGSGFVLVHVKNSIQLSNLQKILDALVQAKQLQIPAAIGDRGEPRHQLADPRAVDIRYVAQVEQNLFLTFADQIAHHVAKSARSLAEGDPSRNIHYAYVAHLPGTQLYTH